MTEAARLYSGAELSGLQVNHVIPVRDFVVTKLAREYGQEPCPTVIVFVEHDGKLLPCSSGAGELFEASKKAQTSIRIRIDEVSDLTELAERVADSTRAALAVEQHESPVRLLQMALGVAEVTSVGTCDASVLVKAVRRALDGKWAPNRLKEVIGPVKPRTKSRPSPFASITNEGELEGVFAKLVEFNELVCSEVFRPCGKNFTPNIVASFKFVSSVYTAETLDEAHRMINDRELAYKDLHRKQMPRIGQEEEEQDEEEEGGGEEGEEEDVPLASVSDDFDAHVQQLCDKHGKRMILSLIVKAAKKLRQ